MGGVNIIITNKKLVISVAEGGVVGKSHAKRTKPTKKQ